MVYPSAVDALTLTLTVEVPLRSFVRISNIFLCNTTRRSCAIALEIWKSNIICEKKNVNCIISGQSSLSEDLKITNLTFSLKIRFERIVLKENKNRHLQRYFYDFWIGNENQVSLLVLTVDNF